MPLSDGRPSWLLRLVLLVLGLAACGARGMTGEEMQSLRGETRAMFYHGYNNYMTHAFPEDELRPLSCAPLTRDRENPAHIAVNDVLGNYSLTLIDSLSSLAILASEPEPPSSSFLNEDKTARDEEMAAARRALRDFQAGVELLVEYYGDGSRGPKGQGRRARGFDVDSKVQVFETVIRGVGGLLSAHLFAVGDLPIRGYVPQMEEGWVEDDDAGGEAGGEWRDATTWTDGFVYDGQLLRLALDLAQRLLPAFETRTGLPYPRVNLRHGIPFYANAPSATTDQADTCGLDPNGDKPRVGRKRKQHEVPEITETCSAGAGSLVLEFATLSRLTGDTRFERAAKRAFAAVWSRRSAAGLVGAGIDAETGLWVSPYTGIGAGIDSFFEYAFKAHVLLSGLPYEQDNG
ncbi:glycoside hydrolase, partial [Lineolata rhizophorae]